MKNRHRTLVSAVFWVLAVVPVAAEIGVATIDRHADASADFMPAGGDTSVTEVLVEFDEDLMLDDFTPDQPADREDTAPPLDSTARDAPGTLAASKPPTAAASDSVERVAVPADWVWHEFRGVRFATPADFQILEEDDDQFGVGRVNMAEKSGIIVTSSVIVEDELQGFLSFEGMEVTEDGTRDTAGGATMLRYIVGGEMPEMPPGTEIAAVLHRSQEEVEPGKFLLVLMGALNLAGPEIDRIVETIDASLDFVPPDVEPAEAPVASKALSMRSWKNGLLQYAVPEGWQVRQGMAGDSISFLHDTMSLPGGGHLATVTVRTGRAAAEEISALAQLPERPTATAEWIGAGAKLYDFQATADMGSARMAYAFGKAVPAVQRIHVLDDCLPGGKPITITENLPSAWMDAFDATDLTGYFGFVLPAGSSPCPAVLSATADFAAAETSQSSEPHIAVAPAPQRKWTLEIALPSSPGTAQVPEAREPPVADELSTPDTKPATSGKHAVEIGIPETVTKNAPTEAPAPKGSSDWTCAEYRNTRFDTVVSYPQQHFVLLPPPENGDGQSFEARDGSARFSVFAHHNALGSSLFDRFLTHPGEGGYARIDRMTLEPHSFSLFGARGGQTVIHVEVYDQEAEIFHVFEIAFDSETDEGAKDAYRRMTAHFHEDSWQARQARAAVEMPLTALFEGSETQLPEPERQSGQGVDPEATANPFASAPELMPVPNAPAAPVWTAATAETQKSLKLQRPQIAELQARLTSMGYDPRGIDGQSGKGTRTAVAEWQQDAGIPSTGYLDEAQMQALWSQSESAYQAWMLEPGNEGRVAKASSAPARTTSRGRAKPPPGYFWYKGRLCRKVFGDAVISCK